MFIKMCALYEENIKNMKKEEQLYCRYFKNIAERTVCENCSIHCIHNMNEPQNLGVVRIKYEYEVGDTVWTLEGDELRIDEIITDRLCQFPFICTVINGVLLDTGEKQDFKLKQLLPKKP